METFKLWTLLPILSVQQAKLLVHHVEQVHQYYTSSEYRINYLFDFILWRWGKGDPHVHCIWVLPLTYIVCWQTRHPSGFHRVIISPQEKEKNNCAVINCNFSPNIINVPALSRTKYFCPTKICTNEITGVERNQRIWILVYIHSFKLIYRFFIKNKCFLKARKYNKTTFPCFESMGSSQLQTDSVAQSRLCCLKIIFTTLQTYYVLYCEPGFVRHWSLSDWCYLQPELRLSGSSAFFYSLNFLFHRQFWCR